MTTERSADQKIITILLGATRFPLWPAIDDPRAGAAFAESHSAVVAALSPLTSEALDLFDSERLPDELCLAIEDFLKSQSDGTDLIVYYVGHGSFLGGSDPAYFLALRKTAADREYATGLRAVDLAQSLRRFNKRTYLLLDCCFAGSALPTFQSALQDVIGAQLKSGRAPKGLALLSAASRDKAAIIPRAAQRTMFTDALCDVLANGVPGSGARLTLRQIKDAIVDQIRTKFAAEPHALPEVHTPRQVDGDVADFPLFPNHAIGPPEPLSVEPQPTPAPPNPSTRQLWRWTAPALARGLWKSFVRRPWRWVAVAALAGALSALAHRSRLKPVPPPPSWLAENLVPTVLEAGRLGKDLATASGHYLEKQPSSESVFGVQVADLRSAISRYNEACEDLRANREKYRARFDALGQYDPMLRGDVATLLELADAQFTRQELPEVDVRLPFDQQHQKLVAQWREYETMSGGPLKQVLSDVASLETRILQLSGVNFPDCAAWKQSAGVGSRSAHAGRGALPKETSILADYVSALQNLAQSVQGFEATPVADVAALRAAASPLKAAILRNNAAYARVSSQRLALTLDILKLTPPPDKATAVVCALAEIDSYQNDDMNPLLNGLLVNIISAWRDEPTEDLLREVRAQQQVEWRELHEKLVLGAAKFSVLDAG